MLGRLDEIDAVQAGMGGVGSGVELSALGGKDWGAGGVVADAELLGMAIQTSDRGK